MSRPNGAVEFVGAPVRHHTKRIKPEEWEKWKPVITALFSEFTLKEVITRMELEHGFFANERQYTHHLGKWGVRKQGRGTTAAGALSLANNLDTSSFAAPATRKRPRPAGSIHSVSSVGSSLSTSKPPRKRVEHDATSTNNGEPEVSLELETSEHDWVTATALTSPSTTNNVSEASIESPVTPLSTSREASPDGFGVLTKVESEVGIPSQTNHAAIHSPESAPPETLDPNGFEWPIPPVQTPFNAEGTEQVILDNLQALGLGVAATEADSPSLSFLQEESKPTLSDNSEDSTGTPLTDPPTTSSDAPDTGLLSTSHSSPPRSEPTPTVRAIRAIDSNRPIETFSAQDISDIKHAAECLSMFCCNREAFELYTTILKRRISDDACRDPTFWYLIIQCAHTASIPEHAEVIQSIIRAELVQLQTSQSPRASQSGNAASRLLLRMLLAFTSSRAANAEGTTLKIEIALAETSVNIALALAEMGSINLLFPFLALGQSLVLTLYRNMLRLLEVRNGESCDLTSPAPFDFRPYGGGLEKRVPLEVWILYQTPGPFEIQQDGLMANPCIRSCISWCQETLLKLDSIPTLREISDICTDRDGRDWAEVNALFVILWENWVTCKPFTKLWMTETQMRMGISATELLLLVCRAIYKSCHPDEAITQAVNSAALRKHSGKVALRLKYYQLIEKSRERSKYLASQPDLKLARAILKEYVSRNTVTMWPSWRSRVQQFERARMMKTFENVLLVRFPRFGATWDLIDSVLTPLAEYSKLVTLWEEEDEDEEEEEEGKESLFHVFGKAQQFSPTLASSLSSVDLSAFRKTSTSAMVRFSKFLSGSASASFRGWHAGSKTSVAGESRTSDLSRSFQSMSISGDSSSRRRASSQVVRTSAAPGNDWPVGQCSEIQGVEWDKMSVATWI